MDEMPVNFRLTAAILLAKGTRKETNWSLRHYQRQLVQIYKHIHTHTYNKEYNIRVHIFTFQHRVYILQKDCSHLQILESTMTCENLITNRRLETENDQYLERQSASIQYHVSYEIVLLGRLGRLRNDLS